MKLVDSKSPILKPEKLLTWDEWVKREYPDFDFDTCSSNDIMYLDEEYKEYGRENYAQLQLYECERNSRIGRDLIALGLGIIIGGGLVFFLILSLATPTDIHP